MICAKCAAAADLREAGRAFVDTPTPDDRIQNVVGRPFAGTVILRAATRLHADCRGCDCQHRVQLRAQS